MRTFSPRRLPPYRSAIAATNSSRTAMLTSLIEITLAAYRRGANQMRQQLSVGEHFWRGNARLRDNKPLNGALAGITAAVVGVILNLAIWFALHIWFHEVRHLRGSGLSFDVPVLSSIDPWALLLSIAAMVAIFRFKAGMIQTLLACSLAGIVLYLVGAIL